MIKISTKNGSIITEVLVTMVIIVITMVSIVPMFYTGVKASKSSKVKSINTNIVQKEIENLSQQKFSKVLEELHPKMDAADMDPPPLPDPPDDYYNFIRDNSDPLKKKDFEISNTCILINRTNGDFQNLYPTCDSTKISYLEGMGYTKYQMKYTYSYSKGLTATDDALQVTIELRDFNADSKAVSMTTILTKDKL